MFIQRISRLCNSFSTSNSHATTKLLSVTNENLQRSSRFIPLLCMKLERFSILSDNGGFTVDMAPKNKQSNKFSNEQNFTNKRNQISLNQKSHVSLQDIRHPSVSFARREFHTTNECNDIMEFFDKEENWGVDKIRVGRSWQKEELRLKSNEDLHKLWYILLKERNMLLTMEQAYKDAVMPMPNEERIDKVQESMENLEVVVRERNRAYFELETGGSGERERVIRQGPFGLPVGYSMREHALPWQMNSSYRKMLRSRFATCNSPTVKRFVTRYLGKIASYERWSRMIQMRRCANLLKRFPDADEEALQEKFPIVDIKMVKRWKRVLGHHNNHQYDVHVNTKNPYGFK